jgi:hypothetical protein
MAHRVRQADVGADVQAEPLVRLLDLVDLRGSMTTIFAPFLMPRRMWL